MESQKMRLLVVTSLFWKMLERSGTQGVQFILQVLLARLLLPKDYGLVALVSIFIAIANVFVQSGFSKALVQKKDADDLDFSSVFYLSLFVAGILYIILFMLAPVMADFYDMPKLTSVFRVLSLTLFTGAIYSVQTAIIAKRMAFKKLFLSSVGSIIISGVIGILLAYKGYGVWALVAQQLINTILMVILLWITVDWRPKALFSFVRIKSLFRFGWRILLSSLIDSFYRNLKSLVIGKIYSADMLGYFNRGKQFPQLLVTNINGSIQSVLFPTLASSQDDKIRVKAIVRRAIVTSAFIVFPMMIGLAVTSEALISIILTDKWLPSVPFVQIFCISYAIWPIHTANLQAINALGRSDIYLKLEIIKKVIGLIILIISVQWGIYAIAFGGVLSGLISSFINAFPNKKLFNYSYSEQIKDILPSFFTASFMGILVYSVRLLELTEAVTLLIQIPIGIIIYITVAKLLKLECYVYLVETVRTFSKKERL